MSVPRIVFTLYNRGQGSSGGFAWRGLRRRLSGPPDLIHRVTAITAIKATAIYATHSEYRSEAMPIAVSPNASVANSAAVAINATARADGRFVI
jgi:hypothetical protein